MVGFFVSLYIFVNAVCIVFINNKNPCLLKFRKCFSFDGIYWPFVDNLWPVRSRVIQSYFYVIYSGVAKRQVISVCTGYVYQANVESKAVLGRIMAPPMKCFFSDDVISCILKAVDRIECQFLQQIFCVS